MPHSQPLYHSQKLIKCSVTNEHGQPSVRLVELENFKLWEYMVTHKHGLSVTDLQICLWFHEEEFRQNESIFLRSGQVEGVNRILISVYDPNFGYCYNSSRYVEKNESEKMVEIIRSHMPENVLSTDGAEITVIPGYIVHQVDVSSKPLVLGIKP